MKNLLKNWFSKDNIFYQMIFYVSLIVIITNRILLSFDSILWIADIGSICGILYVINMAKHNVWGFIFNIISTIAMVITGFVQHIWLNATIALFINLPNLVLGLIKWNKNENTNKDANLKIMKSKSRIVWWIVTIAVSGLFTYILWLLDGNLFYLDAPFTALCMVGVLLSSRMYIEQYHFFLPSNFLGVAMYIMLSLQTPNNIPYILTNIIYLIVNLTGFIYWKKLDKERTFSDSIEPINHTKNKESITEINE